VSAPTMIAGEGPGWRAVGVTWVGHQRASNEDALLFRPDIGLFGVFDGVGGHQAGATASSLAVETVQQAGQTGDLAEALEQAHRSLAEQMALQPSLFGMGSTGTVMRLRSAEVEGCWVGDSRAYSLAQGAALECLTTDHTVTEELVALGAISAEQAKRHPGRSTLTRCLGGDAALPKVDRFACPVMERTIFLLCSDGLSDVVEDKELHSTLSDEDKLSSALDQLIELAAQRGAPDNVSAILVQTKRPD